MVSVLQRFNQRLANGFFSNAPHHSQGGGGTLSNRRLFVSLEDSNQAAHVISAVLTDFSYGRRRINARFGTRVLQRLLQHRPIFPVRRTDLVQGIGELLAREAIGVFHQSKQRGNGQSRRRADSSQSPDRSRTNTAVVAAESLDQIADVDSRTTKRVGGSGPRLAQFLEVVFDK